ncbi:MAG TPA: ATP-grasp domain-containing protein [Streptosporangiaceae bacterium]|nr:ATP-grasp domain-containing protein [Streptosporangiaceae bacterium]
MKDTAIIVDPYAGAADFATAFAKRGVSSVALFSTDAPLETMPWSPELYADVHFYGGDLESLVTIAEKYDPLCIVPGNEGGVELAGVLTERVTPHLANVPGSAPAQRDKGHQYNALVAAGVPLLRQLCSADADEVAEWIVASGLRDSALVIKPPKSAGTDSVFLVEPGQDWRPVFEGILGETNSMGVLNEAVVVMEFAEGPEFMVDTYSVDGQHGLVMVSVYGKHNRGQRLGIYDMGETLAPDDPRTGVLFEYTKQVADAVGVRNAACHAEVILTSDGPRLVEIASRFSGSCMQVHQRVSTGDSQIDRAVRHYLDGEFVPYYEMVKRTRTAWLSAHKSGRLVSIERLEKARDLATFAAAKLPEPGITVTSTVDIDTSLGWIILASDSQAAIEADYAWIREQEAQLDISE